MYIKNAAAPANLFQPKSCYCVAFTCKYWT